MKKKKDNKSIIILSATIIIALSIIVSLLLNKKAEAPDTQLKTEIEEAVKEDPVAETNFSTEQNWKEQERAQKIINNSQDKEPNTERIISVVSNPLEEDMFFLATQEVEESEKDTSITNVYSRIYTFDNKTGNWERIYKQTKELKIPKEGETLDESAIGEYVRLLGYDSNKLILISMGIDESPGPCYSEWTSNKLETLNLDSPYSGFTKYTPPETLTELKKQETKTCENNL